MCDCAILAPRAPDAARLVPNAARLVQDAAAIGARWCEIARDAAGSVRDARSLKAVGEGSRNLHRHTHHTRTAQANTQHTQCYRTKKLRRGSPGGPPHVCCALVFYVLPGHKALDSPSTDTCHLAEWRHTKLNCTTPKAEQFYSIETG